MKVSNMPRSDRSLTDKAHLAHVGAHRRGVPAKLALDPELRAFIEARLPSMTFAAIMADVAAHFPPDRWVSLSSVHRWWQKMQEGKA